MTKKRKVILEIRRSVKTTYLVLSSVNCLSPEVGSVISESEARSLIHANVDVVVKNPKRI
jgi:hypothetical protein